MVVLCQPRGENSWGGREEDRGGGDWGGERVGKRKKMTGAGQRRPVSKLSLLAGLAESFSSVPAAADSFLRSPTARSFGYEGAVGLGIVAAMSDGGQDHSHGGAAAIAMTPRSALPRRSEPIPIFSARSGAIGIPRRDQRIEEEEDEQEREMMSESYTCVISHVEGSTVRKRVYLDDGGGDLWGCCPGVFFDSPPAASPAAEDFLSRCFRCRRALHGIDIFIYRGDKAFCSAECRSRQIASEEQGRSKYPLDAPAALDCSPSPAPPRCSSPPASPPRSRKLRR